MANEILLIPVPYLTGRTVYAQVRNAVGQIWNTSSVAFESYTTANIANYKIALTEQGTASGQYVGTFPSQITVGVYGITAFLQAAGAVAEGDQPLGGDPHFSWTGTVVSAGTAYLPQAQAGANTGLLISGTNTGPMSISGGVTFSNSTGSGFTCSSSGSNGNGINCTGNGTGDGLAATGGATGRGIHALGGATSGAGLRAEGQAGNANGAEGIPNGTGKAWSPFALDASGRVEVQSGVTKNAALSNFTFLMISSVDHTTPATGLTVTAQRSLDGGAFASCANAVSEISNGMYKINLAATDMNANVVALRFSATGAEDRDIVITTTP